MAWAPHSCFLGKAKVLRVLSWQDSLEFPHLAETGMKEEEEGGLAGDSLGGVVHADSRAGPPRA